MKRVLLLRRREGEEGAFTMVEMLAVILIIGILTAIAIPMFAGQKTKAWDANATTDARNIVTAIETAKMDYAQFNPDSVYLEGFSPAKEMDIEVTVIGGGMGMAVGGGTRVHEDLIKLSPDTRGSIGGTLGDYTICLYNPSGDKWSSPDTAFVWDSASTGTETDDGMGGGTFRDATKDDECVKVAKARDPDYGGPSSPGTPGDDNGDGSDSGDGSDDGEGNPPVPEDPTNLTVVWNEPHATPGAHWTNPMTVLVTYTVRSNDGEELDGLALTGYLNGSEVRTSSALNAIGSNTYQGSLVVGNDTTPAGGLLELRVAGTSVPAGTLNLSSYSYLGEWTNSWTQMSARSSDVASLSDWLRSYGIPSGTESILIQKMGAANTYNAYFQDAQGGMIDMTQQDIVLALGVTDFRNLTIYPQAGRAEYVIEQGANPIVHFTPFEVGTPGSSEPEAPGNTEAEVRAAAVDFLGTLLANAPSGTTRLSYDWGQVNYYGIDGRVGSARFTAPELIGSIDYWTSDFGDVERRNTASVWNSVDGAFTFTDLL